MPLSKALHSQNFSGVAAVWLTMCCSQPIVYVVCQFGYWYRRKLKNFHDLFHFILFQFYSILNWELCCFACRRFTAAPCKVNINRGRIFYNAKKIWIGDLKPNRVLHGESVVFYCLNKELKCGIPVASQCIDGTLNTPECFKGEACRTKITWSRSLWHFTT